MPDAAWAALAFQMRAVLSRLAVAIRSPSGLNATPTIALLLGAHNRSRPVTESQTRKALCRRFSICYSESERTIGSVRKRGPPLTLATSSPLGLNATPITEL